MTTAGRHIAIVAPPLPGHFDPLRVLADRLGARGHRITFVHMGDAQAMVTGRGFGFEAVGRDRYGPGALAAYKRQLARAPTTAGFFDMLRATAAITDMLLGEAPAALARIGAEALIVDSAEAGGGLLGRHSRLPFVTSVTGLPLLREPGVPPPFVGWPYRGGWLGRRRNAGGYWVADRLMRPIARVLARRAGEWQLDPLTATDDSDLLQVAQCPLGLDFPRRALPPAFRYCGPWRPSAQPTAALAQDDRPLVYCSLGSLQGDKPHLFAAMSAACADLGARAVVAHGGLLSGAQAAALPGDPLVAPFWPQPAVLPRCRAAILHGGFNTVLDALAAGVPSVVAPLAFEQPGTAARVARTGAGVALFGRLNRRRLRAALAEVLTGPAYRAAAARMAADIDALGGADLAANLIDQAVRTGAPAPPRA